MPKVYIILTRSLTPVSTVINLFTHDQYTHASISLSENQQPMYSIGRHFAFLPAPASFKTEYFDRGFYWWHRYARVGVYSLQISEQGVQKIADYLQSQIDADKKIRFSYIGLINAGIGRVKGYKNRMFCSEYVANALKASGEIDVKKDPPIYHPVDFLDIDGISCEFTGRMTDLCLKVYGRYARWSF